MNQTLLVRPNLKLFLLGAILIAGAKDLITNGRSEASVVRAPAPVEGQLRSADKIQELLEHAWDHPNPAIYMRISEYFEKNGELKNALFYQRKAQLFAQLEDSAD